MDRLKELNEKNDVTILSVRDPAFRTYGRVLEGYDFGGIIAYMEAETPIPADGNIYVPSCEGMEALPEKEKLQAALYGGMPIQIGYCNGRNRTYNGFEYHKGSEINVAVTDLCLVLGHSWDICDDHYNNDDAQVFFVEKGTAFEMYQTTLHLSPVRVTDEGFKAVVILQKGTNTPLTEEEKALRAEKQAAGDPEAVLLLQRNKWVIAHPERKPLIDQGAFPGIIGPNKMLNY